MLEIHTAIHVGALSPFSLLHVSDTHLTRADERDDQRKNDLAAARSASFPQREKLYQALLDQPSDRLIIHTGDLCDFVSEANLDAAEAFTSTHDCLFAAGNHEFSLYVGEAFEDAAYREQSFDRVQRAFRNPIRFAVRTVNGVKLIILDNSYYLLDAWQVEALSRELSEGLPTVLCMHTPLYTPELSDYVLNDRHQTCDYLMASPEEITSRYEPYRRRQQTADPITREGYELMEHSPCVKALLTGHLHFDFLTYLRPDLPQYVTGTETLRQITFD